MITPLLRKMILLEEISITTSLYEHALKQLKESKKKNGRQGLQAEVNRRKADMAWALLMGGEYEQAYNLYKSLPWDGYTKEKCLGIGIAFTEVGNLEGARIVIDGALEDFPDSDELWLAKGNLHKTQGQWAEALQCYDHALEIDAKNPRNRLMKATALYGLQRYDEAIPLLEALAEANPDEPHFLSLLANCHLQAGSPEISATLFQNLIGHGCHEASIYNGLFRSYLAMEDIDAAFETALAASKHAAAADGTAFCNLAYALLLMDRVQESRAAVNKGLRIYPGHEGLMEMLDLLDKKADAYYDKAHGMMILNHVHTGGVKWN